MAEQLIESLLRAPTKIRSVYSSLLTQKGLAQTFFNTLQANAGKVTEALLEQMLEFPTDMPADIADLYVRCLVAIMAQQPSLIETVFHLLIRQVWHTPKYLETNVSIIKRIVKTIPLTLDILNNIISGMQPLLTETTSVEVWLLLLVHLELSVGGLTHTVISATLRLLIQLDTLLDISLFENTNLEHSSTTAAVVIQEDVKDPICETSLQAVSTLGKSSGTNVIPNSASTNDSEEVHIGSYSRPFAAHLSQPETPSVEENEKLHTMKQMLDLMDKAMLIVFQYLDQRATLPNYEQFFDICLCTYMHLAARSRVIKFVQFILFYGSSLDSTVEELFVTTLCTRAIYDMNLTHAFQTSYMNYLASFLARYRPLKETSLIQALQLLTDFAQRMGEVLQPSALAPLLTYLQHTERLGVIGLDSEDAQAITASASVIKYLNACRALFYVACFIDRRTDLTDLAPKLLRVATCSLNPLFFFKIIAQQFARVATVWNCYTPMELGCLKQIAETACKIELPYTLFNCFYPFEPYILRVSGECITPLYRDFLEPDIDESDDEYDVPL
ncbi:Transcription factor RRN3 [Giardia muris]|uniref:Transcription factor RRN3 n=1 Tax=Giardia muris TaxID=5742 RepID=A0A4Z1T2G9_GIAMU|nr:Transcription factor RRN3 [Giardia muris]|eukprot:TNJ29848.1 Transcription factor RRN3 [Giardia muris]